MKKVVFLLISMLILSNISLTSETVANNAETMSNQTVIPNSSTMTSTTKMAASIETKVETTIATKDEIVTKLATTEEPTNNNASEGIAALVTVQEANTKTTNSTVTTKVVAIDTAIRTVNNSEHAVEETIAAQEPITKTVVSGDEKSTDTTSTDTTSTSDVPVKEEMTTTLAINETSTTPVIEALETTSVIQPVRYGYEIDFSQAAKGVVRIFNNYETVTKSKLIVESGTEQSIYNLYNNSDYVNYPLQFGDGLYTVSIYENTTGTKYKKISSESFEVVKENKYSVYLQSVLEIKWKQTDQSIILANSLVEKALEIKKSAQNGQAVLTDKEIIHSIYAYVVKNIKYDYSKASNLDYSYVPVNDATIKSGTGICYDYSSLLAAMLRSQGIPTKMIKGYANGSTVYHAWNEIYIASENRWIVVDSTFDAALVQSNNTYTFEKKSAEYNKVKEF